MVTLGYWLPRCPETLQTPQRLRLSHPLLSHRDGTYLNMGGHPQALAPEAEVCELRLCPQVFPSHNPQSRNHYSFQRPYTTLPCMNKLFNKLLTSQSRSVEQWMQPSCGACARIMCAALQVCLCTPLGVSPMYCTRYCIMYCTYYYHSSIGRHCFPTPKYRLRT